jgi:hypothetical protein
MSGSTNFFVTGWEHIVDINAYDHVLFVMALCAAYRLVQWRQIVIIITAFTVGHSGTLILSALGMIPTNQTVVEILIPFTIMLTAILNVARKTGESGGRDTKVKYGVALGFGLVHGLAFANNFKVILFEDNIIVPLLLFNLGIEVGQIFIVVLLMGALWIYDQFLNGEHSKWNQFLSGACFGVASLLLIEALSKPEVNQAASMF